MKDFLGWDRQGETVGSGAPLTWLIVRCLAAQARVSGQGFSS